MNLHGSPLKRVGVSCPEHPKHRYCSAGDVAATRVITGATFRKLWEEVGTCERVSNSGCGGGRLQVLEQTRNLPKRVELTEEGGARGSRQVLCLSPCAVVLGSILLLPRCCVSLGH